MKVFTCFPKPVLTILVITILSNFSCSKNDVNTIQSPPIIDWITPGSAFEGDTVTITGQFFTGTFQVNFGAAQSSFRVENATIIKAVMPTFTEEYVNVSVETKFGKATKKGFRNRGPLIFGRVVGYNNSDEVGKDHLVAYWGFNSDTLGLVNALNTKEYFSKLPPVKLVNATRNEYGVKGNSLYIQNGYLIYPTLSNLNGEDVLSSYTVSLWVNPDYTTTYVPLFLLTGAQYPDLEGQIQLALLNKSSGSMETADTMYINWVQAINTGSGINSDRWNVSPQRPYAYYAFGGSWTHLVISYEGVSHVLVCYLNGSRIGFKTSSAVVDPAKFRLEAQAQVLFGSFAFTDDGFPNALQLSNYPSAAHGITAGIDEVRIYNAALTDSQIEALFELGMEGK